jgi:hypothetical protein
MSKIELLNELLSIVENVCKDGIVSPNEVSKLQDWVDENSVEFVGEEYNTLICPLQDFLDNGEFCGGEQKYVFKMIKELIKGQ